MRVRRAIKRFVLGLLLLGVVTVVAAVIFLHTDTGREVVRDRDEPREVGPRLR